MAPSGPSIIHLLNGLYDANLDHQTVAAIIDQQKRMAFGDRFQQELENDTRRRGPGSIGRDEIAERYAERGVGSVFVYTHEAHPGENYPHLTSMEQKATAH